MLQLFMTVSSAEFAIGPLPGSPLELGKPPLGSLLLPRWRRLRNRTPQDQTYQLRNRRFDGNLRRLPFPLTGHQ